MRPLLKSESGVSRTRFITNCRISRRFFSAEDVAELVHLLSHCRITAPTAILAMASAAFCCLLRFSFELVPCTATRRTLGEVRIKKLQDSFLLKLMYIHHCLHEPYFDIHVKYSPFSFYLPTVLLTLAQQTYTQESKIGSHVH